MSLPPTPPTDDPGALGGVVVPDLADLTSEAAGTEPGAQPMGVTRSEEEVRLHTINREVGKVRARKVISSEPYDEMITRDVQEADVEHVPAAPGDSGKVETLEDGSVSIPIFEEEIVIEKRLVLRERIIVRKRTVTEQHQVTTDVRKERIEVEVDASTALLVQSDLDTPPTVRS